MTSSRPTKPMRYHLLTALMAVYFGAFLAAVNWFGGGDWSQVVFAAAAGVAVTIFARRPLAEEAI